MIKLRDKTRNETSKDGQPTLLRRQGEHLSVSVVSFQSMFTTATVASCHFFHFFKIAMSSSLVVLSPGQKKNNNYMIFSPKFCNYWQ